MQARNGCFNSLIAAVFIFLCLNIECILLCKAILLKTIFGQMPFFDTKDINTKLVNIKLNSGVSDHKT